MTRFFSFGLAAAVGLSLLSDTQSFAKGGGHHGGHGHSSGHSAGKAHGAGKAHSGGHAAPSHSSAHAHSSGHPGGQAPSTHAGPSHPAPQLSHNSQLHPQPTHQHAAPPRLAGKGSTSNHSFSHSSHHSGGHWHHHHGGWAWSESMGGPWTNDPYSNGATSVVVVPEETEIVQREYVTQVTPPPVQPAPSLNPNNTDPDQAPQAP